MSILYYDCFSGISGDMNLGALVDLGVDQHKLIADLKLLKVGGYTLSFAKGIKKGISGTRAIVKLSDTTPGAIPDVPHQLTFAADTAQPTPSAEKVAVSQAHGHHHRSFNDIKKIINESALNDHVKAIAITIFKHVAIAEGKIHNQPPDEVHFHEVGAIDSIVDIVGAAICIDYLKPDRIVSAPVELGSGTVKCAHGVYPVPAPATLEILSGKPVTTGGQPFEATTPTGAAILAATVSEFTRQQEFTVLRTGYGLGFKESERANVLRVFWAESSESSTSKHFVMECNLDDMSPEASGYLMDKLFACGADDVWFTSIGMKKSRMAVTLSVLHQGQVADSVAETLLRETTTLGYRRYEVDKFMLDRTIETVHTKWGDVRVKKAFYKGEFLKAKPEYDDCLAIATKYNLRIEEVYKDVNLKIVQFENLKIRS